MREELLAQLEEQRACPDIAAATGFSFAALEGELTVAGVFVRVFVEQPGFAVADPAAFCKARLPSCIKRDRSIVDVRRAVHSCTVPTKAASARYSCLAQCLHSDYSFCRATPLGEAGQVTPSVATGFGHFRAPHHAAARRGCRGGGDARARGGGAAAGAPGERADGAAAADRGQPAARGSDGVPSGACAAPGLHGTQLQVGNGGCPRLQLVAAEAGHEAWAVRLLTYGGRDKPCLFPKVRTHCAGYADVGRITGRRMHGRNDLPTGQIPRSGSAANGVSPEEEHDFRLAGLSLATLVVLVAHAGAATEQLAVPLCPGSGHVPRLRRMNTARAPADTVRRSSV